MSNLEFEETGTTCSGLDFHKFFESAPEPKKMLPDSPPALGYTASWVKDASFEIIPTDELSTHTEFDTSDLPSTVGSCKSFEIHKKNEKKKELAKKRSETKRFSNSRLAQPSEFFKKLKSAQREIEDVRKGVPTTSTWRIHNGICTIDDLNTPDSQSQYDELMNLFQTNINYNSISFENNYHFNWTQYDENRMQYVIFTKTCPAHPPEMRVEMTKEQTKCHECSGSSLTVTARLTVPLDLTDISFPLTEDVAVHVAFLPEQLGAPAPILEDLQPETIQKMFALYQNVLRGIESKEYEQWVERAKGFVKSSLDSKSMRLFHGRVARRKLEGKGGVRKLRCFIFADVFDID